MAQITETSLSEEAGLLQKCAKGDENALERLASLWTPRLYSLAYRILRDGHQAEEVVQDSFLKIWTHADTFDPSRGGASSWIYAISHRTAIDRTRRNKARGANLANSSDNIPQWAAARQEQASPWQKIKMEQALESLTEPQRQVVMMAYFEGLSREEMAQALGEPLGTVKTRLRDALIRLRKNFADPDETFQSCG